MTVRVTVKTHGCPCTVSVEGMDTPVRIDHHQDRTFDISGAGTLTINEEEPSADHGMGDHLPLDPTDVPGRAENDALIGQDDTAVQDGPSGVEFGGTSAKRGRRSESILD